MGSPMAVSGYPEGSLDVLLEGERISKELDNVNYLAMFYNALGVYHSFKGDPRLAMRYSEDAFREANKNLNIEMMVPPAYSLSFAYNRTGEFFKLVNIVPAVIGLIEETHRESDNFSIAMNPYSILCAFCGFGMGNLGNFHKGKTYLEKGLRHAIRLNDILTLGVVEMFYGYYHIAKGSWRLPKGILNKASNTVKIRKTSLSPPIC